jgi:monothiol glutaredoxin
MPRQSLTDKNIHPAIKKTIDDNHADIVSEVQEAIANHKVVVVGMAQNPAPKRARKTLNSLGIEHAYLEYGSYFKLWRRRNALKMWTGWPSFPMIFINGTLIGGSSDLRALVEADKLDELL